MSFCRIRSYSVGVTFMAAAKFPDSNRESNSAQSDRDWTSIFVTLETAKFKFGRKLTFGCDV